MEVLLFFITLGVERDRVYHQLPELNAELNSPRNVELNRIIACTPSNITDFSEKIRPVLDGVPPCLKFGTDETALQPNCKNKILVPSQNKIPVVPDDIEMPHITAMCCANCVGDKLQLYIILPYLKKLPSELIEFSENSQVYFSSSPSC